MMNRRSFWAVASAAASVAFLCASDCRAQSTYYPVVLDLRVHGTGAKEAVVQNPGDSVTLDLYGYVYGKDADPTNEGLSWAAGAVRTSTGGLLGDLFPLPRIAPFDSIPNSPRLQDVDGDGDIDIGPVSLTVSDGSFYYIGSLGATMNPPADGFFLGQFRFTATELSSTPTTVTWLPDQYKSLTNKFGANAVVDGASLALSGIQPELHVNPGVVISAENVTDPGPAQYLSGTISSHLTVSTHIKPAVGTTLTLAGGVDVTSTGTLNMSLAGAHSIQVNDSISGNAGSLTAPTMTVGVSAPGLFTNSAGYAIINQLTLGGASGAPGTVAVDGGTFRPTTVTIGAGASGTFTQSGGNTAFGSLTMSSGSGIPSTINLQGGDFSVSDQTLAGKSGDATINHSGGTAYFNGEVFLGSTSAGRGFYNLSGTGTLNAAWLNVGGAGYGEVNQTGGTANLNRIEVGRNAPAGSTLQGKYSLSGGVLNAATVLISFPGAGQVVQTGGTANVTGNMYLRASTLATQYDLQAGQLNSSSTYIAWKNGVLDSDQPGRFTQSGGTHSADHLAIGKLGIYQLTGGTLRINKDLRLQGTLDLANSSATVVAGQNSFVDFSTGTLANTSNATVTGETNSLINFAVGFDPFTQIGNFSSDGLVHIDGEPLVIPEGRSVHGNGNIDGQVTNHGLISPGNSPGAISVTGDYDQANDAALQIELGGATTDLYDALSVTGVASLAGTLNVSLLGDFVPTPDEQFQILTAGSRTGQFDTVNFTGGSFDVAYTPTGVTLSNFTAVPEPAAIAFVGGLIPLLRRKRKG